MKNVKIKVSIGILVFFTCYFSFNNYMLRSNPCFTVGQIVEHQVNKTSYQTKYKYYPLFIDKVKFYDEIRGGKVGSKRGEKFLVIHSKDFPRISYLTSLKLPDTLSMGTNLNDEFSIEDFRIVFWEIN